MSNQHTGNVQPSIDYEEHARVGGLDGKKIFIFDNAGNQITQFSTATVTLITPTTIFHGMACCASGSGPVQFVTNNSRWAIIEGLSTNNANVFVGASGVSVSTGYELQAGQSVGLAIDDTNKIWLANATSNPGVVRFIGGN